MAVAEAIQGDHTPESHVTLTEVKCIKNGNYLVDYTTMSLGDFQH